MSMPRMGAGAKAARAKRFLPANFSMRSFVSAIMLDFFMVDQIGSKFDATEGAG